MNELLQKRGCANVFSVPEGLKELMSDISREVLRSQPKDINNFIANYLSVLLITREHGVMAVSILQDLCNCRPSVLEHLRQLGIDNVPAQILADIIKEEVEGSEAEEGKETVKEYLIVKKILARRPLDEAMTAKVCQVARNAYRDYWYRKKTLEKGLPKFDEPWEIAAEHTLQLYKKTKPSFNELTRAAEKIQAAYRGYHVRRNILRHLKTKSKRKGPKVELPGAPLDLDGSREIDLGPLIDIKVHEDNVHSMFNQHQIVQTLGLTYDPMKTIAHVPEEDLENVDYPFKERSDVLLSPQSQILGSRFGRFSAMPAPAVAVSKTARASSIATAKVFEAARQSRASSVAASGTSSLPSRDIDPSHVKISFANIPPEIILPLTEALSEVDAVEEDVPEDIVADEVLERSETDGETSRTASVPSSAPSTARTSDVEDEAAVITSGDEQED